MSDKKSILIIEDDRQLRQLLKIFLSNEPFEVAAVENGSAGIAYFRENGADMVITDIIMPEKDGIETLREIRKVNKNIKVIAISGGGRIGPEGYLKTAQLLGANATLQKPFKRAEFLDTINRIFNS
ncbi:MAG: response regulator [Acidobacteria bacterium]|nr:MAG: response regulator [Acidobacteriota bacterium]PIE91029.1 MAG: response regulator [Acidobacteriota bacterium]